MLCCIMRPNNLPVSAVAILNHYHQTTKKSELDLIISPVTEDILCSKKKIPCVPDQTGLVYH